MSNIKKPLPKDLPILTDVVGEPPIGVPTLTEVANEAATAPTAAASSAPHLNVLEEHLTALFEQKLQHHFAVAQQIAVQQALAEFKHELPQLIHDALGTPHKPR